jgi:hypothetical protein
MDTFKTLQLVIADGGFVFNGEIETKNAWMLKVSRRNMF